jgi:hypothetical protein
MPHRRTARWVWRNLAVIAIVLGTLVNTFLFIQIHDVATDNHKLALANKERINDIQQARVESCQRTYEGVRQIFAPFVRLNPDRVGVRRYNHRIDMLKAGCVHQTKGNQ